MNNEMSVKKNALLNIIKQLCMIIFPMITFPFASRVLGKYYFGKINFGASIINYITLIAGLGITNYAIREGARIRDNHFKLQKMCNEIFSINLISTIIAYCILGLLIIFWEKLDGYTALLFIQSISVLFTTLGTDWVNSIFEDYFVITVRYIVCQTISILLMLIFVNSQEDYLLYALASVGSTILANGFNILYIRKKYKLYIKFTLRVNAHRHLRPILILFGTAVASLIYINSDITILGILKNENAVGIYSVSAKIYALVKQMLNAMLIVTIPQIANEVSHKNRKVINHRLEEILGDLLIIIVPACVGLFMLSKNIIILFSGKEYYNAYSSLQILSVALLFATIACFYINVILIPFRLEQKALVATVISAMVNIILNFILIPILGLNAAAITTVISEILMVIFGVGFSKKLICINVKREFYIGLANGLLTFCVCSIILYFIQINVIAILLSVFLSVILSGIALFIGDRKKFDALICDVLSLIRSKI